MSTEKKGITVKIDADLHAEIKQYLEQNGITMAQFIEQAVEDELHPKNQIMEENNNMEKMRTLAFQVPEDLFNKIKDYLRRNNISQKQFVIGLIEREIDRDINERESMKEQPKPDEADEEQSEGKYNEEIIDGEDEPTDAPDEDEELTENDEPDEEQDENEENDEESENEDIDEDEEETEGMSMTGM